MDKKQEELGKLYAVRAGLSVISQSYDKLRDNKSEIKNLEHDISWNYYKYNGKTKRQVDKEIDDTYSVNEEVYDALKEVASDNYKRIKNASRLFFRFLRLGYQKFDDWEFESTIGKKLGNNIERHSDPRQNDEIKAFLSTVVLIVMRILLTAVLLVFEIFAFPFVLFSPTRKRMSKVAKAFKNDKHYNDIIRKIDFCRVAIDDEDYDRYSLLLKEYNYNCSEYDNSYVKTGKWQRRILTPSAIQFVYETNKVKLEKMRQEGYEEVDKLMAEFEDEREEKNRQCEKMIKDNEKLGVKFASESKKITAAMKSEISSTLGIRDWGNVDLIIYYYETGRADSVKEALQLVDAERRGNDFDKVLRKVKEEVANSIRAENFYLDEEIIENIQAATRQDLRSALFEKVDTMSSDMALQMQELNSL